MIAVLMLLTFTACRKTDDNTKDDTYKDIKTSIKATSNGVFADLGDYIILLDEYTEIDYEKTLAYADKTIENLGEACTAIVKTNKAKIYYLCFVNDLLSMFCE